MWYQSHWSQSLDSLRSRCVQPWLLRMTFNAYMYSDWNPAADQQALARVWRDGQKKECTHDSTSLSFGKISLILQASCTVSSQQGRSRKRYSNVRHLNKPFRLASWMTSKTPSDISLVMSYVSYSYSRNVLLAKRTRHLNANDAGTVSRSSRHQYYCTVMQAREC